MSFKTLNERESRRQFLQQLAAASTAALMAGEPRLLTAALSGEKIAHPKPTADACILLWMGGGMGAPD
ncbi:MAG: twin-arginine translocation signal domain-containing protein, partial [Candidatus Saccharimonas sp.]|nr:twin-arginine translocation signal domain-containing protein [Planctomycetaceae bacterium]